MMPCSLCNSRSPVCVSVSQSLDENGAVLDILSTRKGVKYIMPVDDIVAIVLIARDLQDVSGANKTEGLGCLHRRGRVGGCRGWIDARGGCLEAIVKVCVGQWAEGSGSGGKRWEEKNGEDG